MKVLVTGADGLLGSHLIRELLDKDFSVRALIQPGENSPTLEGLPIEHVTGDLLEEDRALLDAATGCRFVFHCAAITDYWADPSLTWGVNLEGTRRVLDACLEAGVERLIAVGSASSFQPGPIEDPGDERAPFPPVYRGIPYMESKYQALELVRQYVSDRGLDAVVLAPTFMLGAHDYRPSSGELIRQMMKRGLKYVSPGGRNFTHARDVARAMVSALDKGKTGECYIAGGQNMNYVDFFSMLAKATGVEPPRRVIPKALLLVGGAAGSMYGKITGRRVVIHLKMARLSCINNYYSTAKAERELGMTYTPIEVAIEESVQCLKEYGHIK